MVAPLLGLPKHIYYISLGAFTFFAVLKTSCLDRFPEIEEVVEDCVLEKLTLIPDQTKFVTNSPSWSRIEGLPETLYVDHTAGKDFFTLLGDILKKRWQTMDLISMMEEVNRELLRKRFPAGYGRLLHGELRLGPQRAFQLVFMQNSLSSVPRFKKSVEQNSPA